MKKRSLRNLSEPKTSGDEIPTNCGISYVPCSDFDFNYIPKVAKRVHTSYEMIRDGYITKAGDYKSGGWQSPVFLRKGRIFRIHRVRGEDGPNAIMLMDSYYRNGV